ncbi:MAG TPA: GNAT family N-acetyltransferase [Bryobacteraceae bacterium]|nr:GNAT family N-acetyltransferase [Bryobacteraceae bacterium]
MNIRIRRFTAGDLPRVMRIERASFGSGAWPAEWLSQYADAFPELFLIAALNARAVGYIAFSVARGWAELVSIAVLPACRRRGIATALLARGLQTLRRRPVRGVFLMVRRGNEPAVRLYESAGFQRVRTVARYYEDGSPALRMRLVLPGTGPATRRLGVT